MAPAPRPHDARQPEPQKPPAACSAPHHGVREVGAGTAAPSSAPRPHTAAGAGCIPPSSTKMLGAGAASAEPAKRGLLLSGSNVFAPLPIPEALVAPGAHWGPPCAPSPAGRGCFVPLSMQVLAEGEIHTEATCGVFASVPVTNTHLSCRSPGIFFFFVKGRLI